MMILFVLLMGGIPLSGLPFIPGCPLHESCVRALRAEQRARRRAGNNRDRAGLVADAAHNINLGLAAGLDDLANMSRSPALTLKPALAYFGNFGDFDLYLGAFYTLIFTDPPPPPLPLQRGGLQETLGYNFLLGGSATLTVTLDNDNQFNFTGDENVPVDGGFYCMFANLEPSLTFTQDLSYGDVTAAIGLPVDYSDFINRAVIEDFGGANLGVDAYLTLGYNTSFGLGVQVTPRVWIRPDPEYGETELTLTWTAQSFYLSLTVSADALFREWDVEPYLAYTYKNWTFTGTVLFEGIGRTGTGNALVDAESGNSRMVITPSLGVRYRFQPGKRG
jgi:hypothetical protein